MVPPEFSRIVERHRLPPRGQSDHLVATEAERAALAERFGLVAIGSLEARLETVPGETGLSATGTLEADVVQQCVVSGQPLARRLRLPLAFAFEPDGSPTADEIELDAETIDILPLEAGRADLGEAVAQTLFLALDPYPKAAEAELAEARRLLLSEEEAAAIARADRPSPFAQLRPR